MQQEMRQEMQQATPQITFTPTRCHAVERFVGCWRSLVLPYESVVFTDFGGKMKEQEYLAINPMGKVPALKHGESDYHRMCGNLRLFGGYVSTKTTCTAL
jgi:glutathione S-transferase